MIKNRSGRYEFQQWVTSSNYDTVTKSLNDAKDYLKTNSAEHEFALEHVHVCEHEFALAWDDYLKSFKYKGWGDYLNHQDKTILSIVLDTRDWKMFELLLDFGFNPYLEQHDGPNLLISYARSPGEIYQEPIEIMLNRGVSPFYESDDSIEQYYYLNFFPLCIMVRIFPDLFKRFIETNESNDINFYLKYPRQILLAGICGNISVFVRKSIEVLAQRGENFKWLYKSDYVNVFYSCKDEEIFDIILQHLSVDEIDDVIFREFKYSCSEGKFYRSAVRYGYNLNKLHQKGYLIERLIHRELPWITDGFLPTLDQCNRVYDKYYDRIHNAIKFGLDPTLNRIPIQGKLKELFQPEVRSLQVLSLRKCCDSGIKLSNLPHTFFI